MQTTRLWGDVTGLRRNLRHALLALPLIAACGGNPEATQDATPRICPAKTSTATVPAPTGAGGDLTSVTSFGANPAGLAMYVHAPPGGKARAVVVALHGCTQNAQAYVAAGWNELADAAGFAVVYAEQTAANNGQQCFRWWDSANITRGKGEAQSIASMAEHAKTAYGAKHAYVTGLSAGAAMAAVMLATYPDLFEAGAIMAGLPYACATSQNDAFSCMNPGKDKTPSAWGALLPKVSSAGAPRVSIWHGSTDFTVRPANLVQLVRQWTDANGIPDKPTASAPVGKATHDEYRDAKGAVRVESWTIAGMSHGVSVDPSHGCGKAGAYVIDEGLCSTRKAAEFFTLVAPGGGPGTGTGGPASGGAPGSSGGSSSGAIGPSGGCDP